MKKRVLSIILAVMFVLPMFSFVSFADTAIIDSGTCGENVSWSLDSDYCLTISGNGKMDNFIVFSSKDAPWQKYKNSIKSLVIKPGVTSIGNNAFSLCKSLKSLIIPESVTAIGDQAFSNCALTELILPAGLKSIGSGAFQYNSSLVNVKIPNGIEEIPDWAFYWNNSLVSIVLPNTVKKIGFAAFARCSSLLSVVIPDKVTYIDDEAFRDCNGLCEVNLPDALSNLGRGAFQGCKNLKEINIPSKITQIGDSTFFGCKSLESVIIPEGVKVIGKLAFCECSALASISLPDSVTRISEGIVNGTAFYNNRSNWEKGLLYIGHHLIASDSSSRNVAVKKGTLTIGANVFYNLTSISIPKSVISINYDEYPNVVPKRGYNIYYEGNESDRKKISIHSTVIADAFNISTWHYNSYSAQIITLFFKDVKVNKWYNDAVLYVYEKGLMSGVSKTEFAPDTPMTRAMLVTVLYRMEGSPAIIGTNTFTDVKAGQWYTDAVIWATANNIVFGMTPNTFNPNGNITREQMASILYRYTQFKKRDVSARADLSKFKDGNKVSSWAKENMSWANAEGLITGTNIGLEPTGNATRAQVASILMRYCQKY